MLTAIWVLGSAAGLGLLALAVWGVVAEVCARTPWPGTDDGLNVMEALHAELMDRSDQLERIRDHRRVVHLG